MVATQTNTAVFTTQLREKIEFAQQGVSKTILVKHERGQATLVCLKEGTTIPEHATCSNVTVTVIEGRGIFTLEGNEIALEPGVFIYMPANTSHSIRVLENLVLLKNSYKGV